MIARRSAYVRLPEDMWVRVQQLKTFRMAVGIVPNYHSECLMVILTIVLNHVIAHFWEISWFYLICSGTMTDWDDWTVQSRRVAGSEGKCLQGSVSYKTESEILRPMESNRAKILRDSKWKNPLKDRHIANLSVRFIFGSRNQCNRKRYSFGLLFLYC